MTYAIVAHRPPLSVSVASLRRQETSSSSITTAFRMQRDPRSFIMFLFFCVERTNVQFCIEGLRCAEMSGEAHFRWLCSPGYGRLRSTEAGEGQDVPQTRILSAVKTTAHSWLDE